MGNDAVRRIMAEVAELRRSQGADALFVAHPLDEDMFEWHFTVRGPPDTAFAGGVYHGRILLPPEYPLKAPEIMLLTPNGRFELNVPICLSVTAHHQETWQPSWGIRTILTALVGFMPSPAEGLGALDFPDHERRKLALRSHSFACSRCGARPVEQLPPPRRLGSAAAAAGPSSRVPTPNGAPHHAAAPASPARRPTPVRAASTTATATATTAATTTATTTTATTAPSSASATQSPRPRARRRATGQLSQERGLLLAAYAILALIAAIIVRRFM